jgi:hypothetical protein
VRPGLRRQLTQTIYVAAPTSTDADGVVTYSAPASYSARVESYEVLSHDKDGRTLMTRTRIFTEQAVTKADLLWLPGDDSSDAGLGRSIENVLTAYTNRGVLSHYEVHV